MSGRWNASPPGGPSSKRFGDRQAIILIAVVITVLFADVLFFGAQLFFSDVFTFHFPLKQIVRDELLSGNLPEWNRWIGAGQPLAANPQYEIFYPPQWLILLPSFLYGFQLHILLHLYIAAIGMYHFIRRAGGEVGGALFGALAFGLGGLTLSHLSRLPLMFSLAWMPLVLAGGMAYIRSGSVRPALVAATALAMQFIVGEPFTALQTLLLLGGWAVVSIAAHPRRETAIRGVAGLSLIVLVAVSLSAVQLLPAIDFARDTVRAARLSYEVVAMWSFPLERLVELVNPRAVGTVDPDGQYFLWGVALYAPQKSSPYFLSIYPGLLVTILAFAGWAARIRGWWQTLAGFAVAVVAAAGANTPLLSWAYESGIATSLRYFEKFTTAAVFILIVFAARAFDGVAAGDRRLIRWAGGIAGAIALLSLVISVSPDSVARALFAAAGGESSDAAASLIVRMRDDWRLAGIVAAVAALLLVAPLRWAPARTLMPLLLIGFAATDLGARAASLVPRESARLYSPPPIAAAVPPGGRLWQAADWFRPDDVWTTYGRRVQWYLRNTLSGTTPAAWGIPTALGTDIDETSLKVTDKFVRAFWEARRRQLSGWPDAYLAMSGVTHVTALRDPGAAEGGNLEDLTPADVVAVAPAPRAWFASAIRPLPESSVWIEDVARSPASGTAWIASAVRPEGRGSVEAVREASDSVEVAVRVGDGAALLLLAVTPHRYWRATIDGEPAELIPANVGYQAVVVPAGARSVQLVYRNPLIRPAAAVSLLALALVVALYFRRGEGRRAHD